MIMQKKMQVAKSPILSNLRDAYTCNIILCDQIGREWLYNTYIQWEWKETGLENYMPENIYSGIPIAKTYVIPNELLPTSGQMFVDMVKKSVESGFYVVAYVNKDFSPIVEKNEGGSPILIYGYDNPMQKVYIMSDCQTTLNNRGICTFEQLAKDYECLNKQKRGDGTYTILIKRTPEVFYRNDVPRICGLIEDYLESRPSQIRYDYMHETAIANDPCQGMNVYDRILEKLDLKHGSINTMDISTFSVIRDHKYVMYDRIKYLEKKGYVDPHLRLSEQYEKVYIDSEDVKLLAIEYVKQGREESLISLVQVMSKMREMERSILGKMVEQLHMARELLDKAIITPLGVFDMWIPTNYMSYSSVRNFAENSCVTIKAGDSITAWDIVRNDQHVTDLMAYGSVSYLIANVKGQGSLSVYFDLTGSDPVSVLELDPCAGTQIRTSAFYYTIPPGSPFLRTDFHFCAQGNDEFSFDLYAIRLNCKFREKYVDHFELIAHNSMPCGVSGEYVKLMKDGSGKPLQLDFLRRRGVEYRDAYTVPWHEESQESVSFGPMSRPQDIKHIKYYKGQDMPHLTCDLGQGKVIELSLPRVAVCATDVVEMTAFTESHGIGHSIVSMEDKPYCVTFVVEGSWVCYRNLYFDRDVSALSIYASTNENTSPCFVQVFVDRLENEAIANMQIQNTRDLSGFQWSTCDISMSRGYHDVFFVFRNPDRNTKVWLYRFS